MSTKEGKEFDDEKELGDMLLLEDDEEVKEGKGLKVLTPKKLLTRIPILLAQIKAVNNSYKFKKMKSDKYYIFCISAIKPLKKFATV